MKLLPVLLLICLDCGAQTDTVPPVSNKFKIEDTLRLSNLFIQDTSWVNKEDTVKVLMLVCDTATLPEYMRINIKTGQLYQFNPVTWQFGYLVSTWFKSYYLDERRRPLSKSVVVWMSKPVH